MDNTIRIGFTPSDIENWVDFFHHHLDDEFWKMLLIQGKRLPELKDHPWAKGYYDFRKKKGKRKMSQKAAEMGTDMGALFIFREYWTDPKIKRSVIRRLKKPDTAGGLLFEFRIANHYKSANQFNVQMLAVPPGSDKICDIILSRDGEHVEIECSNKMYRANRPLDKLVGKAKSKATQLSGNNPSIIAIHVPEHHDWRSVEENKELGSEVQRQFSAPWYSHVNQVVFSCHDDPQRGCDVNGNEYFDTRIRRKRFNNPNAKYKLPIWFVP